jgi:hypothetical protein
MRMIGAPDALVEFNEYIYLADQKINVNEFNSQFANISGGTYSKSVPVLDPTNVFSIMGSGYTGFTTVTQLSEVNLTMALKRKRNIGKFSHPSYQNFLNILRGKKEFIEIDCDIAAIDLINKCKGVVSMPFSSTALIARELGKPSVYYDPTGYLTKSDLAAHGITVLSSYQELRCWVSEVSNDREVGRYG